MKKPNYKDTFVWGLILWLIGFGLGIVLFLLIPLSAIGWTIMPIGIAITLWVLLKKVKASTLNDYLSISIVWSSIAILFDYLFLVRLLGLGTSYYKPDSYFYYFFTFTLPLLVYWYKKTKKKD